MILWKIDFECEFSENINHLINFPSFWQNQGKFSIDWFFFSVFSALFGFDFFYWKCKSPSAAHANRLTYFSLAALLPPISRSYNRLDTEQSINERKCQYKSKMFSHCLLLCTCFSIYYFVFEGGNMISTKKSRIFESKFRILLSGFCNQNVFTTKTRKNFNSADFIFWVKNSDSRNLQELSYLIEWSPCDYGPTLRKIAKIRKL